MPRNEEYELRFTFEPNDADRVVSHPALCADVQGRGIDRLVSTYFDTPDNILQRHRFGLRIRRSEDAIVHTLKRTDGSFVARGEWERMHDQPIPDMGWLRETPLAPLLGKDEAVSSLHPRFEVDVMRTTILLRGGKAGCRTNTFIEAALDQGTVSAAGVSLPLNELELEMKRGPVGAALDLARRLVHDLPLTLTLASKAERGYGLSDLTWGRPTNSILPILRKDMTIAEVFEAVAQTCLHVFLRNAALIEGEGDGEALHSARIALRHLRAVCQLFKPVLRRRRYAAVRRDLKWLSDKLGAARDADVFQAAFYEPAAREGTIAGAGPLATSMRAHRLAAHDQLRSALASSRARLFFVELLAFSSDGIRRARRKDQARSFVRRALGRRRSALARQARGLGAMPPAEMHDVRKSAKMLRYDLELFARAPKFGAGRRVKGLGKALKVLQQNLGVMNDMDAMRQHLRSTVLKPQASDGQVSAEDRYAVLAAAQLCALQMPSGEHLKAAEAAAGRL